MNNIPQSVTFNGSFGTGKTTQFEKFKSKYQHDPRFHFIDDQGRKMLTELGFDADNMTQEQKEEGQLYVIEGYMREESEAHREGKIAIQDGSLIEALAYSKGVLNEKIYNVFNNVLHQRSRKYTSLYFPILFDQVEDDGLRHTNLDFQRHIDAVIRSILHEHRVRTISIATTDPVVREAIIEMDVVGVATLFR